jgi:hypothetical protein
LFVNNEAQFQVLLAFFSNKRYNRIHNKHLFLVYRASRLPDDPRATSALWRQLAQRQGLDGLYLVNWKASHPNATATPSSTASTPHSTGDPSPRHCNHPSAESSSTSSA